MKAVTIGTSGRILPEGEIWNFNDFSVRHLTRPVTRHFQLHPVSILPESELRVLKGWPGPGPVYTVEDYPDNPHARLYPRAEVEHALGHGPWCSSVDYMLALAIYERFEHILISRFDVQIGATRERVMEHVSVAYWTGVARGRGIRVEHGGHVLKFPHAYGFDFERERTFGQRMAFWALLGMVKFTAFDDGQATTPVQGWDAEASTERVRISI